MKNSTRFFLLFIGILFINIPAYAIIRYVKPTATGLGNGATWANASDNLQAIINVSVSGDEVWVSAGTYKPTTNPSTGLVVANDKDNTFHLKNEVKVYGGFLGTETSLSQRNITANVTILSGDLLGDDIITGTGATLSITNDADNVHHVVLAVSDNINTVLDGFIVTGGSGGGFITPLLFVEGQNVLRSVGGGMYNRQSSITVRNCVFRGNSASEGAGIDNLNCSPVITNCVFSENYASFGGAGMMNITDSFPIITNCVFTGNKAQRTDGGGGAIYNINGTTATITNCTFNDNSASNMGSAIFTKPTSPSDLPSFSNVKNSVIWGNTGTMATFGTTFTIDYSVVQGATVFTGTANTNLDPVFVNSADPDGLDGIFMTNDDGLRLNCGSAAYNTATSTGAPVTDLLYVARPQFATLDMGAYESTINLVIVRLYVDASVAVSGTGLSWASPYKTLQQALDYTCASQIWVKRGTYVPTKDITGNLTPINPRTKTFLMRSGGVIYGGFAGTETALSQRNLALGNNSILSGNINATLAITDDAYHVVYYQNANTSTILNGFIIQNGNANLATANNDLGGGVFCNGVGFVSTPKIQNCIFTNNNSSNAGGAIFADGSGAGSNASPEITNCIFTNNSAVFNGAAISGNGTSGNASMNIYNCTFVNNTCSGATLSISMVAYFGFSTSTFQNNIFHNNTPNIGVMRISSGGTMTITNNHNVSLGTNITTGNPNFLNLADPNGIDGLWFTVDDGLQLNCNSPCYNSGLNTGVAAVDDIRDWARIQFTTIDKGAYESDANLSSTTRLYVDANIANSGVGFSWVTAFKTLQEALDNTCGATEIWVKQGTYYPTKDITGSLTPANPRTKTFLMKSGMAVYGGFAGTETLLSQRNLALGNNSILSGDFLNNDTGFTNNTENAYHVVFYQGATLITILNGFIIQEGNANVGSANNDLGGGIFCDGVIATSTPKIQSCIFINNNAINAGGGIFANGFGGGNNASPEITNCIFTNNNATNSGSAISANGGGAGNASPSVYNCTFANNTCPTVNASQSVVFYFGFSNATFQNNIFYNNTPNIDLVRGSSFGVMVITNNHTPTTALGTNPTTGNPFFVNVADPNGADNLWFTADDGLEILYVTSICTNTGLATGAPATDIVGVAIICGKDKGAFEVDAVALSATILTRLYVKKGITTGTKDGSTWANAFPEVADALNVAQNSVGNTITAIWVSAGTYLPTFDATYNACPADNKTKTFLMKSGVSVYGGFLGTETLLANRNITANLTVLSGDFSNNDSSTGSGATFVITNNTENAFHVVAVNNPNAPASLDGFTIRGGNANDITPFLGILDANTRGGGIFSRDNVARFTLTNCILTNNNALYDGGGMYNDNANPNITNCTFTNNNALVSGGGLYNSVSSPIITNCTFTNNNARANGGGMCNDNSGLEVRDCAFANNTSVNGGGMHNDNAFSLLKSIVFSNNIASNLGGGIHNSTSSLGDFVNLTIVNNRAVNDGGGICNSYSSLILIRGCIIWANTGGGTQGIANLSVATDPTVSYSCVQGTSLYLGTGNINIDPLLANITDPDGADGIYRTSDDGLALRCGSPAINTGDNTGAPATDILNVATIGVKDRGAYEFNGISGNAFLATSTQSNITLINQCENAGWTYYSLSTEPNKWLIGINWAVDGSLSALNSTAKAAAQVKITLAASATSATNVPLKQGIWTTGRYWDVNIGANTLDEAVVVRYYFDIAEINTINTAASAFAIANGGVYIPAKFFKTVGNAFNPLTQVTYNNINSGNVITLTPNTTPTGTHNGVSYVQFTAINSFSGGGAFAQVGVTPLPVEFLSFSGKNKENANLLTWATTNEVNNAYFEIERSTNAIDFVKIGVVEASISNESIKNYNFSDINFTEITNYYRLKQIDNNGKTDYSKVIAIKSDKNTNISVDIYPNPTKNSFIIDINSNVSDKYNVVVYNTQGVSVVNTNVSSNKAVISLDNYAVGVYFVKISNEKGIITKKIIKE